jgi:ABC-type phosphate transport system substrate-binding protein
MNAVANTTDANGCVFAFLRQIPEVRFHVLSLNLTLELWAAILMNRVTTWNDPRIVAINPGFVGLLPNRTITVVVGTDPSVLTRMVTSVLSRVDASFNATVIPRM